MILWTGRVPVIERLILERTFAALILWASFIPRPTTSLCNWSPNKEVFARETASMRSDGVFGIFTLIENDGERRNAVVPALRLLGIGHKAAAPWATLTSTSKAKWFRNTILVRRSLKCVDGGSMTSFRHWPRIYTPHEMPAERWKREKRVQVTVTPRDMVRDMEHSPCVDTLPTLFGSQDALLSLSSSKFHCVFSVSHLPIFPLQWFVCLAILSSRYWRNFFSFLNIKSFRYLIENPR